MGKLADWGKKQSPFLRLQDGEKVTAKYLSWKLVPDSFNPDKEKVRYELEIDGEKKVWDSGSTSISFFFDGIKPGEMVRIKAVGEGTDRRYHCEKVK